MGGFAQNGPEPSRARRCWARRSEPLTARTVLRRWSKRERGAKGWGAKMAPSLGASNSMPGWTEFSDVKASVDGKTTRPPRASRYLVFDGLKKERLSVW